MKTVDEELRQHFAGIARLLIGSSAPDWLIWKLRVEDAQRQLRKQLHEMQEVGTLPREVPLTEEFIELLSSLPPILESPTRQSERERAELRLLVAKRIRPGDG